MPQKLSYVLCRGSGLGTGLLHSKEDVFTDLVLCRFNDIVWIDVSRVVARAAVNSIHSTVRSDDRVIVGAAEQLIYTETAIYAVVTASAIYLVETTAPVAIVVASLTRYGVLGTESVDAVQLIGALEVVLAKGAPYVFGQRYPAEHHHSYQQSPAK
jgi:hypothetical protein